MGKEGQSLQSEDTAGRLIQAWIQATEKSKTARGKGHSSGLKDSNRNREVSKLLWIEWGFGQIGSRDVTWKVGWDHIIRLSVASADWACGYEFP